MPWLRSPQGTVCPPKRYLVENVQQNERKSTPCWNVCQRYSRLRAVRLSSPCMNAGPSPRFGKTPACARHRAYYTISLNRLPEASGYIRHLEITPVTLIAAKGLARWDDRCFASLSMTIPVLVVKVHHPQVECHYDRNWKDERMLANMTASSLAYVAWGAC